MIRQYFQTQTRKALKNFPFSFRRLPKEFIFAIVEIKKASALAHFSAGELDQKRKQVIVKACDEILSGKFAEQFVLPAFQGGAGTSNHMNVNEVVAGRATEILSASGGQKDGGKIVHPNDHVNMSQSTNDVMPSALKLAAVRLTNKLLETLAVLISDLEKKSRQFQDVYKLGRTHMQDAVPITLGAEFAAYAEYVKRGRQRIKQAGEYLLEMNLGGSAVGNSLNVSASYKKRFYAQLRKITGLPFRPAKNLMSQTSSNSDFVGLSQSLTSLSLDLSKMANDLRLMSSGPRGGFGEIILPELQDGSSIMPGKVNPILPEALNQMYFLVAGNNLTIEHCAEAAQLELGVMLPVMTDRLIESLKIMDELLLRFAKKCVVGIKADKKRCRELLENSTAYATLLSPRLGYDAVSNLVKEAVRSNRTLRELVAGKKLLSPKEFDKITKNFRNQIV